MEQAERIECCALIFAAILLFAPQAGFARSMSGGTAGRPGGASFSSLRPASPRIVFNGQRAFAPNPASRAFIGAGIPARSIQPIMAGARINGRSAFFNARNGQRLNFRQRRPFINTVPIIVAPYQPFFGYPSCDTIYFRAYNCPAIYNRVAPVYVPIPVPVYFHENPYDEGYPVSAPLDNGYYIPANNAREPAAASTESFDRQGDHAFHARDYVTALRDWQHAVVDDPNNGGLAMKLALAMFAVGKYPEAAGTTQHALALLPQEKWGEAFRDYKRLYARPNDYSDQLKSLAKASADKPSDPALCFLLGFHYGYSDRVADATRELDKLVQLEPKDQLGRKLRDAFANKTGKDSKPATAVASSGIYTRKDSNGTVYFSNVPADLKKQPTGWERVPF